MHIPASGVFRELWDTVANDQQQTVPALPDSALAFFLSRIPAPSSGRSVVVVLAERNQRNLSTLQQAVQFWRTIPVENGDRPLLPLVTLPLLLTQERSGDIPTPRLRAFWQALISIHERRVPRLILTMPRELRQPAPKTLTDLEGLPLQERQTLPPAALIARLIDLGYSEEKVAEAPGTFARRGGIVDVFPFADDTPLRVEYVGNIIDHLTALEPPSRNGNHRQLTENVHAVMEKAAGGETPTWTILPLSLPKRMTSTLIQNLDKAYVIAEDGALPSDREADLVLRPFGETSPLEEAPTFQGDLKRLRSAVEEAVQQHRRVLLLTSRPGVLTHALPSTPEVQIIPAETAKAIRGFRDRSGGIDLLTDGDIGETNGETVFSWDTGMAYARRFRIGDFVVHRDHGIARFRGIERKTFEDSAREYLVLEYAQRDRLYVPVELASKVTAYIGTANPVVHRLGGTEWESTTRAVRAEASDMARELLNLYAAREIESGTAYPPDTQADDALATSFPYDETPDQAAAIREVKRDMERAQPMDRLVCGDVGFGKTEVAIRAAFKAVNFGRQVAILSPTTLLAQQHYDTFRERLQGFPVTVALLSRLQSAADEARIISDLREGKIQIMIGTHRLLSEDVEFKNLGLLIIDEEQKFGVAQKERLKKVRSAVDVLSLSATPIPRTLHMALSNLRALSVIATAPTGRRPVITKVARESDALIKKALEDELNRGGQAYILWNRVETIEGAAERIRKLVPKARTVVAHGQMPETELMRVMETFDNRHADFLVCSTIIENGIDLPHVNTLIVFDAPSFGLSDLYQLRGRVGRGNEQAFAYFLYTQGRLPLEARKRLAALLEAVELGSGWTLALRDLEIRGAGNLLGREQHGTIRAVGVNLFGELLKEEVEKICSGKVGQAPQDVHVDLPLRAFLPEQYIPNTDERLAAYARLSAARSVADLTAAAADLETSYGPLATEAQTFLSLLKTKFLASEAGVSSIAESTVLAGPRDAAVPGTRGERRITLTFHEGLTPALAYAAIADNPRWTFTGSSMFISRAELLAKDSKSDLLDHLAHILRVLAEARRTDRPAAPTKSAPKNRPASPARR